MFSLKDKTLLAILSASPIGMVLADKDGNIVFVNTQAERMFDYIPEIFCSLNVDDLLPIDKRLSHVDKRAKFAQSPQARRMGNDQRLSAVRANQQEFPVEVGLSPVEIDNELYVLASVIDRTEGDTIRLLETANQQLQQLADHDALTKLANRRLFVVMTEKLLSLAARHQRQLALLFIDLDKFKQVNDHCGHDIGDRLLITVADTLLNHVRKSDVVSRIGGDEFLICLNEIHNKDDVIRIADNLRHHINSIDHIDDHLIDINASIGVVTVTPTRDISLAEIIRQADQMMYQAKHQGRGQTVYSPFKSATCVLDKNNPL